MVHFVSSLPTFSVAAPHPYSKAIVPKKPVDMYKVLANQRPLIWNGAPSHGMGHPLTKSDLSEFSKCFKRVVAGFNSSGQTCG